MPDPDVELVISSHLRFSDSSAPFLQAIVGRNLSTKAGDRRRTNPSRLGDSQVNQFDGLLCQTDVGGAIHIATGGKRAVRPENHGWGVNRKNSI